MIGMKKIFFAAAALALFSLAPIFGQEQNDAAQNISQGQEAAPSEAQAQENSAANTSGGFQNLFGGSYVGGIWPNKAFLSFQPRLSFWTSYYLWDGKNALPAEIENRTAFVLNFMLDLPAAATFRFQKFQVEAGAGLGILARAAMLAGGVGQSDTGASGSAGGDKAEIQKWFWSNARFLYPEIFAAWEWNFTDRIAAGFELRYYLPIGSLANGRGLTESIFALSAKLIF